MAQTKKPLTTDETMTPETTDNTVKAPEYTGTRVERSNREIAELANRTYQHGWVTDIEMETVPHGLNEDVIRLISAKKEEPAWLLEWRLKAFRHWQTMTEPRWANVRYPENYQAQRYYAAPKRTSKGRTASTGSTVNSSTPLKNWASRSKSRSACPAWRWTRCSTACPWPRPIRDPGQKGIIFCSFSGP